MLMNKKDQMHPEDQRNLILFAIAALLIWFYYDHMFIQPKLKQIAEARQEANAAPDPSDTTAVHLPRAEVIARTPRIAIDNGVVSGTINLQAGRIDAPRLRILPLFKRIQALGQVPEADMLKTFNLGIGMTMVCAPHAAEAIIRHLAGFNLNAYPIGTIVDGTAAVRYEGKVSW